MPRRNAPAQDDAARLNRLLDKWDKLFGTHGTLEELTTLKLWQPVQQESTASRRKRSQRHGATLRCRRNLAERIMNAGRLIRENGLESSLDAVPIGVDERLTIAVSFLRNGELEAIVTMLVNVDDRSVRRILLWLRGALRNIVFNLSPPLPPPDGWEGPYYGLETDNGFKDIEGVDDLAQWIVHQLAIFQQVSQGTAAKRAAGESVRNAHRLARKVGLPNIGEMPIGSITVSDAITTLENLRNRCLDIKKPSNGTPKNLGALPAAESPGSEGLMRVAPAARKAYLSFKFAESECGRQLLDYEAHEWLKENGFPTDGGDSELTDYKLPKSFDTWCRYVRTGRAASHDLKHEPRAKRPHGKSITSTDDL